MVFAKRPNDDLERPYRSNLLDLTVLSDEQLRRRRLISAIGIPVFLAILVLGCIGLASDPRTIGQISLTGGAFTLGLIMTGMLVGAVIRIQREFASRNWARTVEAKDRPDDGHRPWDE